MPSRIPVQYNDLQKIEPRAKLPANTGDSKNVECFKVLWFKKYETGFLFRARKTYTCEPII